MSKYKIDIPGKPHLYSEVFPEGAEVLGVVTRLEWHDPGALVKLSSGAYVQMNYGVVRTLDQAEVRSLLQ